MKITLRRGCLFIFIFIGCLGTFLWNIEEIKYRIEAWQTSFRLDDDKEYFDSVMLALQPKNVSLLQETVKRPRVSEVYGECIVGSAVLIYGSEEDFSTIKQYYLNELDGLGWLQGASDYESLLNIANRETQFWKDSKSPWMNVSIYSATIQNEAQYFRLPVTEVELREWKQTYSTIYFIDVLFADPYQDCFW